MALIILLVLLALGLMDMNKGIVNIATVAKNAGFSGKDLITAVAVALAESNGNAMAVGDTNLAPSNGPSYGLWQINIAKHAEFQGENLFDPQTNANGAYSIWQQAGGWGPWSTFTKGKYLLHLPAAAAAVADLDVGVSA